MRTASITLTVTFDIILPAHLDVDWVADKLMFSDRFSTLYFKGDPLRANGAPVKIIGAHTSIESVVKHNPPAP